MEAREATAAREARVAVLAVLEEWPAAAARGRGCQPSFFTALTSAPKLPKYSANAS